MLSFSGFGRDVLGGLDELSARGPIKSAFVGEREGREGVYFIEVKEQATGGPPAVFLHFQALPDRTDAKGLTRAASIDLSFRDDRTAGAFDYHTLIDSRRPSEIQASHFLDKELPDRNIRAFEPNPLEWNKETRQAVKTRLDSLDAAQMIERLKTLESRVANLKTELAAAEQRLKLRQEEPNGIPALVRQARGVVEHLKLRLTLAQSPKDPEFFEMMSLCSTRLTDPAHKKVFADLATEHRRLFKSGRLVDEKSVETPPPHKSKD
jgi:hypothetical protein